MLRGAANTTNIGPGVESSSSVDDIVCERCHYNRDCCCTFSCQACGKRVFSILAYTHHKNRTCPVVRKRRERMRTAMLEKKRAEAVRNSENSENLLSSGVENPSSGVENPAFGVENSSAVVSASERKRKRKDSSDDSDDEVNNFNLSNFSNLLGVSDGKPDEAGSDGSDDGADGGSGWLNKDIMAGTKQWNTLRKKEAIESTESSQSNFKTEESSAFRNPNALKVKNSLESSVKVSSNLASKDIM